MAQRKRVFSVFALGGGFVSKSFSGFYRVRLVFECIKFIHNLPGRFDIGRLYVGSSTRLCKRKSFSDTLIGCEPACLVGEWVSG